MKELGNTDKQEVGRWANNRVENSHLSFRRRERAMLRFRQMKTLQKFASVRRCKGSRAKLSSSAAPCRDILGELARYRLTSRLDQIC